MSKHNKYAWTWSIKQEYLGEYVSMHLKTWQEVLDEHTAAGIKNYSIFQNGCQMFYCFECDDVQRALKYLADSTVCQQWNAITSTMMDIPFDFAQEEPIKFLNEIFYLS